MAGEGEPERNAGWVDVQKRAFTRWANQYLTERMLSMNDLQEDLKDGVKLCELLEIISSKQLGKFNKKPKTRYQFLENNQKGLQFIKEEGLTLVGIGPEDIVDGKLKLDLGLMWTLILRYQINMIGKGSPKWELLQWVRAQIEPYNVHPKGDELRNFTSNWQDGKVLYALTDSLKEGIITPFDMSGLSGKPLDDITKAMNTAEEEYKIPKLLDPEDLANQPDELAMMAYISYFRDFLSDEAKRRREELERKRKTADPSRCYAEGPGISKAVAREDAHFNIISVNCLGDKLPSGGCHFQVELKGPGSETTNPQVKDNGDGTYSVVYNVKRAGKAELSVKLAGQDGISQLPQNHPGFGGHIKDSPFHVTVEGPNAGKSYADGPGLKGAVQGKETGFTIHSVDDNGNPVKSGGDPFDVKIKGPRGEVKPQIKDNGDGTYSVKYTPDGHGDHTIDVSLHGDHIKDAPFHVGVKASPSSANTYAEGPGLEGGQQGKEGVFRIVSVDDEGKPIKFGGYPFNVEVAGPQGPVKANVTDNGDGTYGVKYTPTGYGDHRINVDLEGQPIKKAPFTVRIKSAPNANNTYAEGPGLQEAWDNEPAHFTIHAMDNDGKSRGEGGDPIVVKVTNNGKDVPVQMKDNGDGTYSVSYQPDAPGDLTVNVELEGSPIKDAPFSVKAKAGTDAENSGFGIFSFTLQARDKRGQQKTFGGDNFEVHIKGPSNSEVEVQTTDNQDGTYTAIYALSGEKGRDFNINAKLNGKTIGEFKQQM